MNEEKTLTRIILKNSLKGSTTALFVADTVTLEDLELAAKKLHPYKARVLSSSLDFIGAQPVFAQVVVDANDISKDPAVIFIESTDHINVSGRMVVQGVFLELEGGSYDSTWSQMYKTLENFDIREESFTYRNDPKACPDGFGGWLVEKGLIRPVNDKEFDSVYVGDDEVYVGTD